MIQSLLIANRGEIACRIIRTARAMSIRTIAVYSDADADSLHVIEADDAVAIGPPPARESYLIGEKIIAAARSSSAEAVHPGYGFLSENADFAQAVIDAGLIWVGPAPASIRAMGLKDAAKSRMIAAGVPVTPGYLGEDQSADRLEREAEAIGYPLLIKAVAGGGGKGMRRVDDAADFADALASCRREAASSFGDDRVLIENYILSPRHIEVQVFGDSHGNLVHLFERDCSLQRRHQKVIEEAPAPGMDDATRTAVCDAAVRAARAVDYVGAGTIEFIADASEGLRADRIWFMEMNTRLQVEHPVTEAITGIDLVEWQLRIASGEPLARRQEELEINGWAIEARLYAEDPSKGFLPSTGTLEAFNLGDPALTGVRIDSGVGQGAKVSAFYDPMIAKLIAHGASREESRELLINTLSDAVVWPVRTNAGFLVEALKHPEFIAGSADTGLIARGGETLMPRRFPSEAVLAGGAARLVGRTSFAGFRLNAPSQTNALILVDDEPIAVDLARTTIVVADTKPVLLTEGGQTWAIRPWRVDGNAAIGLSNGTILSPMPGRIISVEVAIGHLVSNGQRLITIEAMKMEQVLLAPYDGIVVSLEAVEGAQVTDGAILARIEMIQD